MSLAITDHPYADNCLPYGSAKASFEQPAISEKNESVQKSGNRERSCGEAKFRSLDRRPAHEGPGIYDDEDAKEKQRVQHKGDEAVAKCGHAISIEILGIGMIAMLFSRRCVVIQHARLFKQMLGRRDGPSASLTALCGGAGFPLAAWTLHKGSPPRP